MKLLLKHHAALRLISVTLVFIISLSSTVFGADASIEEMYLQKLQNDNPGSEFFLKLTKENIIAENFGKYGSGDVIYVTVRGIPYSDMSERLEIAGYVFSFTSGGSNERFLYYHDGNFTPVVQAYETGLLSAGNIHDIAIARGDLKTIPFSDVAPTSWYFDAVEFVYHRQLFDGISPDIFAPHSEMTRAMLVTVLWRHEQSEEIMSAPLNPEKSIFSDVDENKWYTEAVTWASDCGIVFGMEKTLFCPNDIVTREQLAVILYRYAALKNIDISERGDLTVFSDAKDAHTYAVYAVSWAVGNQIILGDKSDDCILLNPRNGVSRAQAAQMLMRFITKY